VTKLIIFAGIYLSGLIPVIATWHHLVMIKWQWQQREEARWIPPILIVIIPCAFYTVVMDYDPLIWIVMFFGFVVTLFTKTFKDYRLEDTTCYSETKENLLREMRTYLKGRNV